MAGWCSPVNIQRLDNLTRPLCKKRVYWSLQQVKYIIENWVWVWPQITECSLVIGASILLSAGWHQVVHWNLSSSLVRPFQCSSNPQFLPPGSRVTGLFHQSRFYCCALGNNDLIVWEKSRFSSTKWDV